MSAGAWSLTQLTDPAPDQVAGFSCPDVDDMQDFLRNDAIVYMRKRLAQTYLAWDGSGLIGFFTLSCGVLRIQELSKSERVRAKLEGTEVGIPGVLLGRLAVDGQHRGKGVGGWMFRQALGIARNDVALHVGCRYLFLDARYEVIDWYEGRLGCRVLGPSQLPPATTRMGFDLFPPLPPS